MEPSGQGFVQGRKAVENMELEDGRLLDDIRPIKVGDNM